MKEEEWVEECWKMSERVSGGTAVGSCFAVIDMHERLLRAMWDFDALLLGDGGPRALFARAISVAAESCSSLKHVRVSESGIDFGPSNEYVAWTGCLPAEVHRDLLCLCKAIFDVGDGDPGRHPDRAQAAAAEPASVRCQVKVRLPGRSVCSPMPSPERGPRRPSSSLSGADC